MVRSELKMGAGGALELDQAISLQSDPWLVDHQLDDTGVVPATMAVEWMAEVAEAGWPGWRVAEINDVRVLAGIRLLDCEPRQLRVRARASSHSDAASQVLKLEIVDTGNKNRVCYRASLRIVERLPDAEASTIAGLVLFEAQRIPEVGQTFRFHGFRFEILKRERQQITSLRMVPDPVDDDTAS